MLKRIIRLPKRAGVNPPAFIPFEREIARYERAKFQKYPPAKLNYALPWVRDFLVGLTAAEYRDMLNGGEAEKRRLRVRQRARLLARKIGMPIKDIHVSP